MRLVLLFLICGCGATVGEGLHKPSVTMPLPLPKKRTRIAKELFDTEKVEALLRRAFLIWPGDRIQIRVVGHSELVVDAVVSASGKVSFPRAGRIQIAGRNPEEIEDAVASALRGKEFVDPQVVVTVTQLVPRRVFILGAVRKPGAYETQLSQPLTLTRLIALAGGFLESADRESLSLIRRIGTAEKTYCIPFSSLRSKGKVERSILLLPGDVIIVPERIKVYVLGSVARPGGYIVESGSRLSHLIAMAGGLTRLADSKRIRLIRRTTDGSVMIAVFDINKVFEGKLTDVVIVPGDVIFVPESLF